MYSNYPPPGILLLVHLVPAVGLPPLHHLAGKAQPLGRLVNLRFPSSVSIVINVGVLLEVAKLSFSPDNEAEWNTRHKRAWGSTKE